MKKLFGLMLFASTLWAQTHLHITNLTFTPEKALLTWNSHEANEADEKVSDVKSWQINFSQITVSHAGDTRTFDPEEALIITKNFHTVVKFLSETVKSPVEKFDVDPQAGILKVYSPALHTITHDCKLDAASIDKNTCQTIHYFLSKIIKYCFESILWWEAGEGTPRPRA